jgi:hypothetical protein
MGQLSASSSVAVGREQVIDDFAYKPRGSKFLLSERQRGDILLIHAERYGCTVGDLLEVEALICSVESLPSYIQYLLFVTMAGVDY